MCVLAAVLLRDAPHLVPSTITITHARSSLRSAHRTQKVARQGIEQSVGVAQRRRLGTDNQQAMLAMARVVLVILVMLRLTPLGPIRLQHDMTSGWESPIRRPHEVAHALQVQAQWVGRLLWVVWFLILKKTRHLERVVVSLVVYLLANHRADALVEQLSLRNARFLCWKVVARSFRMRGRSRHPRAASSMMRKTRTRSKPRTKSHVPIGIESWLLCRIIR